MAFFLASVGISGFLSGMITPIADYGFHQHWNFFVIWLIIWGVIYLGDWFASDYNL